MVKACDLTAWIKEDEDQRLRWLLVNADAVLDAGWPLVAPQPYIYFRLGDVRVLPDVTCRADESLFQGFNCWLLRVATEVAAQAGSHGDEVPRSWLLYYLERANRELGDWREKFLPGWIGRIHHRRLVGEEATWVLSQFRAEFQRQERLSCKTSKRKSKEPHCDGK